MGWREQQAAVDRFAKTFDAWEAFQETVDRQKPVVEKFAIAAALGGGRLEGVEFTISQEDYDTMRGQEVWPLAADGSCMTWFSRPCWLGTKTGIKGTG